jgi:hypothetical protein
MKASMSECSILGLLVRKTEDICRTQVFTKFRMESTANQSNATDSDVQGRLQPSVVRTHRESQASVGQTPHCTGGGYVQNADSIGLIEEWNWHVDEDG